MIKDIPESQQDDAMVAIELQNMWEMLGTDNVNDQLNELTNCPNDNLIQQALLVEITTERLNI